MAQQGRDLVAQRLAAAGWHQHERIAARAQMLDHFALRATKFGMAEPFAQQRERRRLTAGRLRFLTKHLLAPAGQAEARLGVD